MAPLAEDSPLLAVLAGCWTSDPTLTIEGYILDRFTDLLTIDSAVLSRHR